MCPEGAWLARQRLFYKSGAQKRKKRAEKRREDEQSKNGKEPLADAPVSIVHTDFGPMRVRFSSNPSTVLNLERREKYMSMRKAATWRRMAEDLIARATSGAHGTGSENHERDVVVSVIDHDELRGSRILWAGVADVKTGLLSTSERQMVQMDQHEGSRPRVPFGDLDDLEERRQISLSIEAAFADSPASDVDRVECTRGRSRSLVRDSVRDAHARECEAEVDRLRCMAKEI